jgi:hypothetical protein
MRSPFAAQAGGGHQIELTFSADIAPLTLAFSVAVPGARCGLLLHHVVKHAVCIACVGSYAVRPFLLSCDADSSGETTLRTRDGKPFTLLIGMRPGSPSTLGALPRDPLS